MAKESISEKLTELFDLFKSGALSKDEYDQLKSKIISNIEIQQPKEAEALIASSNKVEETNKTMPEKKPNIETSPIFASDEQPQNSGKKSDNNNLEQKPKKNTTIKVGIIAAFLLIFSVAAYFIITGKNDKNNWDEATATKIVIEELEKHSWGDPFTEVSKINHKIVGFEAKSLLGKDVWVAFTITYDVDDDIGVPSLFEFINNNGWQLYREQIGFGDPLVNIDRSTITLREISSDNYCIITSYDLGAASHDYEEKSIYAFINNEFRKIFSMISENYDELEFITYSGGYFDLKVTPSSGSSELYEFNGKEYVKK